MLGTLLPSTSGSQSQNQHRLRWCNNKGVVCSDLLQTLAGNQYQKGPWNSAVKYQPVRMPDASVPSLRCSKAEESESMEKSYPKKHSSLAGGKKSKADIWRLALLCSFSLIFRRSPLDILHECSHCGGGLKGKGEGFMGRKSIKVQFPGWGSRFCSHF